MATYDPDQHHYLTYIYGGHDPGVCCRVYSAQVLCLRGHFDQAIARCRETMALAERESHPGTMAQALLNFSFVHLMRREPVEAYHWAQKGLALCTEFVMPVQAAHSRVYMGWALVDQGRVREGIAHLREGIGTIVATGADMGMASYLIVLARACGENGEVNEGLALLERASDNLGRSDSNYQLPELLRTKGELLSQMDPRDSASESCFQQSLTTARAQGTKLSELKAALHLVRLYISQRRESEARALLVPLYAWFSEGFDTPDLVEAKAVLESLGTLA
jgi:predicted ATPase